MWTSEKKTTLFSEHLTSPHTIDRLKIIHKQNKYSILFYTNKNVN